MLWVHRAIRQRYSAEVATKLVECSNEQYLVANEAEYLWSFFSAHLKLGASWRLAYLIVSRQQISMTLQCSVLSYILKPVEEVGKEVVCQRYDNTYLSKKSTW